MTEATSHLPEAQPTSTETTRQWLLERLREILEITLDRVTNAKTPTSDRIKWSRIVISAGQASNSVLRDVELETLKQQIIEHKTLTEEQIKEQDEDAVDP